MANKFKECWHVGAKTGNTGTPSRYCLRNFGTLGMKFDILVFRDGKFMNGVVHGFFDCRFVGWFKKRCVKQADATGFNIVYKDVWIRYDNKPPSGYWYE